MNARAVPKLKHLRAPSFVATDMRWPVVEINPPEWVTMNGCTMDSNRIAFTSSMGYGECYAKAMAAHGRISHHQRTTSI